LQRRGKLGLRFGTVSHKVGVGCFIVSGVEVDKEAVGPYFLPKRPAHPQSVGTVKFHPFVVGVTVLYDFPFVVGYHEQMVADVAKSHSVGVGIDVAQHPVLQFVIGLLHSQGSCA